MDSATLTALATGLLVFVGLAQVWVLVAQRRQSRLELVESYSRRWRASQDDFAAAVFVSRSPGEYYQVASPDTLQKFKALTARHVFNAPSTWALDAVRTVSGTMSDVCIRVIQGQINISDVYPIFGTALLRQSRPLRVLLDLTYKSKWRDNKTHLQKENHDHVRSELQTWLIYHNGIRRRCLILLDLLWAEAARLEDLPASELITAARAKSESGSANRLRAYRECLRLRGFSGFIRAVQMSYFLRHAELKRAGIWRRGLDMERLRYLETEWTSRLLREYEQELVAR